MSKNYPVEYGVNMAYVPASPNRQLSNLPPSNFNTSNLLKKGCGCSGKCGGGGGCQGGGVVGGITSMVKANPLLFLIGAVAAGYWLAGQKASQ